MILIDDKEVKFGQFPNMEMNLNYNKIQFSDKSHIKLKYETDQDLMNLYILKKYIDEIFPSKMISLYILYMPYSRMDRRNNTYTFNLKYICDFINSMKFDKVYVLDAHSDVTGALLDRYVPDTIIPTLFKVFHSDIKYNMDNTYVMYPDAGAEKRFSGSFAYPTLVGSKSRDFATGNITSFKIIGDVKEGSDVVIIDDLCSAGRSFTNAAKALKELGVNNIYLIVAHCENTIFDGDIFKTDLITKIYTTNSLLTKNLTTRDPRLYIHKLYEVKNEDY